jgi:hypothetical protein
MPASLNAHTHIHADTHQDKNDAIAQLANARKEIARMEALTKRAQDSENDAKLQRDKLAREVGFYKAYIHTYIHR